jgi:outer membrane protein, multidrug efflux system
MRPPAALALAFLTGSAIVGCSVGPDYLRPKLALPQAWRTTPPKAEAASPASLASLSWWDLFEDEQLRALLTTALEENKDLRVAVTRVAEARARVGVARADQLPQLDGRAGYRHERTSEKGVFPLPPGQEENDLYTLSGDASFEVDLWGRLRRASEAARAELLASEAARQTIVVTLVADVASTYLELRERDLEVEITRGTAAARRQSLGIVRDRFDAGLTSALDLRQAQSDLASTEALIPDLEREVIQIENRLSILVGRFPGEIRRGSALIDQTFPPEIPPGLPSVLLERRPDIQQAEENLIAANARIGVAKAAFFPEISLTGTYGVESVALSDLFTGAARVWQVGPRVTLPIFHGGRNRSNLELADAEQEEALVRYEQAVQQAFREAEDALVAHRKTKDALVAQREAVRAARATLAVAESRYANGLTTYLNVLDTQRTLLSAEIAESRALFAELAAVVQLYRALGGGWNELVQIRVSIARPPADVYAFASNPENLPKWASGLGSSIRRDGDEWIAASPVGPVKLKFAAENADGVMDHDVTLESGVTVHNPMRVVPRDGGSEVVFTLIRRPNVSDEKFAVDAGSVEKDLHTLKSILES